MKPVISLVYVYYNTPEDIKQSIKSLREALGSISYEVIVVDNASSKVFPQELLKLDNLKLIKNDKNYGYGKGLNRGAHFAKGKYLLLANPDVIFGKSSIRYLLTKIEKDPKVGVVGPRLVSKEGKILQSISGMPYLPQSLFVFSFMSRIWSGNPFFKKYHKLHLNRDKEQVVDVVSGACILVRKSLFDKIGGFDERFFMYFEEADFCFRIKELGYKIFYLPKAQVIHLVGKSSQDKEWIEKTFEQSRFKFFRKYHGLPSAFFGELFLRFLKPINLLLFMVLVLSAFLNLYRIDKLMMFIGDMGRDYLVARDIILTGKIPLVGIVSSVTWLHQGPISIYFITLAFLLGNFNPVAPAILYGSLATITTFLVYKAGSIYWNRYIGLLSAVFYATSPLVVINNRMPYHTSLIPFFSSIFFIVLLKVFLGKKNLLPFLFFVLGLLLQVELSNLVLIFLLVLLFSFFKFKIGINDAIKSAAGFFVGVTPFIIYDITHKFVQTIGFPIWVINRIRLFFGLSLSGNSTTAHAPGALLTIFQEISGIIFPENLIVVYVALIVIVLAIIRERIKFSLESITNNNMSLFIILSALIISLLGFFVHATPGTAYFPLIFPLISLLIGFSFYYFLRVSKYFLFIFIFLIVVNASSLVTNDYFLSVKNNIRSLPPYNYNFGPTWLLQDEVAKFIVKDAGKRRFKVEAKGVMGQFATGINNFEYLIWYRGGKIGSDFDFAYYIYQKREEIESNQKVIFNNLFYYVVKNENNH